ncbi:hypothetical protein BOTCAL_0341g00020 [Botryotinia calthae]|uniref:Uncharacterized protein n=1 Tax=Botryotinia calthae TaxID=38488 RepID=A0A4Y8CVG2_9HELO|nr:hypothetical protein BOTCAL_0341g00020 [Botryotinia calthae]
MKYYEDKTFDVKIKDPSNLDTSEISLCDERTGETNLVTQYMPLQLTVRELVKYTMCQPSKNVHKT